AEPADAHLDERHADRTEMAAHQRIALVGRALRKARSEIDLDDLSPPLHQGGQRRADRAADRELRGERQLRRQLQAPEQYPRRPVARRAEAREREIVVGLRSGLAADRGPWG